MNKFALLVAITSIGLSLLKAPVPFEATTTEERAAMVGLSVSEFELFSGIVEAESNRSTDGDLEGRIMIALTIWNRYHDSRFPSESVTAVISQRNQFSTYRNGRSVVNGTVYSDQAIIEAYEWIESGEEYPWVLFFNCRGYNYGTPYDRIGGNYFMTLEPSVEVDNEVN